MNFNYFLLANNLPFDLIDNMKDNRCTKTRAAIKKAFYELVFKMPINRITIQRISDLASINRKTFYTYYSGVTDIIEEDVDGFFKSVKSAQDVGQDKFVKSLIESFGDSHFFFHKRHFFHSIV